MAEPAPLPCSVRTRIVLSCSHRHAERFRGAVGEFGDKFRRARESKELSFDDVSNVTKISARMLQAIEEERFDQLPGGVFNKGFIRAYAKHLGLNPEDAVTDYLACLHQAQIDAHEVWQPERPTAVRPASTHSAAVHPAPVHPSPTAPSALPPTAVVTPTKTVGTPPSPVGELPELQLPRVEHIRPRRPDYTESSSPNIPWKGLAALACIVIATFFLWTRHSRRTNAATAKSATATAASTTPAVASVPLPPPVSGTAPTASGAARSSTPEATDQAPRPLPKPPSTIDAATPANNVEEKVVEKSDVTIRSFGPQPATPSIQPVVSLSLVIRATETSWISVTSDGQLVTQETLIAPANSTFHATREIVARVGNAAGVTFVWNGKEILAQGAEAEAKTFVFDAQGMRELTSQTVPQD